MRNQKYVTDSKLSVVMPRVENPDGGEKYREKWEVLTKHAGTCGNVQVFYKKGKAALANDQSDLGSGYIPGYRQISSALALYRTVSLFQCGFQASDCDFYKVNWFVALRHNKTGELLCLAEWKGGFQIFTRGVAVKNLPKAFIKDAEVLLTYLVSDTFTIGYDGVVAGSVA